MRVQLAAEPVDHLVQRDEVRALDVPMRLLRQPDGALMTTDAIGSRVIETKGFDAADAALHKAIGDQVIALLRSSRKRGTVEQVGLGRGVRWKLAGT